MFYPKPEPGLVISYSYLWRKESSRGQVEGRKNRPCAIVINTSDNDGVPIVFVVPITHTEPDNMDEAVELPQATKTRLGLDGDRSWVTVSELNKFAWPGPDLRPVSHESPGQYDYGFLPPELFEEIKRKLIVLHKKNQAHSIQRTE